MNTKVCCECGLEKEITEYSKNGKYYRNKCKNCRCKLEKARYKENPEKFCEKKREFYETNKEELLEKNKMYRKINSEKVNIQKKDYYEKNKELILEKCKSKDYKNKRNINLKNRRETDSKFRLVTSYRTRISECMKNRDKDSRLLYLDCTKKFFYDWIESQFDSKMNWDNYVEYWVLDHVIPIAFFDLDIEKHLDNCFRWYNLRPCKKEDNLEKSDKIQLDIIKKHQEKINDFWYQGDIEIYDWLRQELKYGKNPYRLGDPQPSS